MVIPVYHPIQGHPESGKQWTHMIDDILLREMGFQTTTHDRCIYCCVTSDGKIQLILWQVDNFLLACDLEDTTKKIFEYIGDAIWSDVEKESGTIPFEFFGVVNNYNGVNIKQNKNYIKINCANYIQRLLNSHGWDTNSSKPLPSEMESTPVLSNSASIVTSASTNNNTSRVSNNTPCVDDSNECFHKASDLTSSDTKILRRPCTCAEHSSGTYEPKNNPN